MHMSHISQQPHLTHHITLFFCGTEQLCLYVHVYVCKYVRYVTCVKKYRKAEYVQRRVCFVNVQSSLHENDVFSVSARMGHAAYMIFIMWNSISGLDAWYHF